MKTKMKTKLLLAMSSLFWGFGLIAQVNCNINSSTNAICLGENSILSVTENQNPVIIANRAAQFTNSLTQRVDVSFNPTVNPIANFSYDFWFNTSRTITLLSEKTGGVSVQAIYGQNFAMIPGYYNEPFLRGSGVSVGTNGFCIIEHCANFFDSRFTYSGNLIGWHHIAVVYSNNNFSVYLDGTNLGSRNNGGNFTNNHNTVAPIFGLGVGYPGYNPPGNQNFDPNDNYNGLLDEFRVWSQSLSSSEINILKDKKLTSSNFLGNYINLTFDQGTTANNTTTSGSNITNNNGPASYPAIDIPQTAYINGVSFQNPQISDSYISNSTPISYSWSTGENTTSINVSPTQTTTYSVTLTQGTQTCTSDLTITVNQPSATTETVSACGSYTWKDNTYTQSGTHTWAGTNAAGCDSLVTLNLTITTQPEQPQLSCWQTATFDASSCSWVISGTQPAEPTNLACYESAVFNNTTCEWEVTGMQPANLYGGATVPLPPLPCYISFIFNDVTCAWETIGAPAPAIVTNASACVSYTWEANGATYNNSGQYSFNINCQDYTLNLTINQATTSTVNASINQGETYSFNGQNLTTAGTYTATLQNAAGCDSVVTLNLTVNYNFDCASLSVINNDTSICFGSTVQLSTPVFVTPNSNIILAAGSNFEYAFAPVADNWNTTMGEWATGDAPFGNVSGGSYGTNDFNYITYWPTDGADGDDLFLRKVINLSGYNLSNVIYNLGVDNGFRLYVNGNLIASEYAEGFTSRWEYSGQIPSSFLNAGDNILAIALIDNGGLTAFDMQITGEVLPSFNSTLWSTGETTPSISVSPTETTTYSVTVTQGTQTCTSDVTITVNQPTSSTNNASITEGETYSFNGQNLTTAGTYTSTLQNAAGCDSVVTLNLTVNPAPVAGCYASSVVNFNQGPNVLGSAVSSIRSNATQALGQPEAVVTNVVNFVSLGFGGSITVAFETPIANGTGNDIRLDEATWGNNPCSRYPEKADVFASQDGTNFIYLGQACQDASFDLGVMSWAKYIRLVDVSDILSFNNDADGFDLNGIECLNGAATSLTDDGLVPCTLQEIVNYAPNNRKNGTAVPAPRNNANSALGAPQSNNTINFTALGFGGSLVAKFDYVVFNQSGNDLKVIETSFGNPSCNNYPEKAQVSVSLDNVTWTELGEICQDGEFDLGSVNYAQYIKIQDVSPINSNKFNGSADGYDVDAVVVLNNGCGTSSARLAQLDNTTTPDAAMTISAFPNPMEDYTIVNFDGLEIETDFNFQIMDAAGRLIRNENIRVSPENPTYLFTATELARGIYQVVLSNEKGNQIIRLVK